MGLEPERLAKTERDLRQALQVLSLPVNYQPEEWLLLATIVGEADIFVRNEQQLDPTFRLPLLEQAVDELREVTSGFTDSAFLSSTRAARRRNPVLFSGLA